MRKVTLHITISLLFFSFSLNAQETLRGLQVNPAVQKLHEAEKNKTEQKTKQGKAALELPFFDDFAKSVGYPDESLWTDKYTFTNKSYAYLPISVGVSTFDAIDGTGAIYPDAGTFAFSADTLTSKYINLDYPGDNTIFLSFFYQPGGLGDTPEIKDSLLLEFFSADSSKWYKKWHVVYSANDSVLTEKYFLKDDTTTTAIKADSLDNLNHRFQQVFIPVNEDQYLTDTFQFRFRNYASLSAGLSTESQASNVDQWNLDYVLLDQNRSANDTIYNDFAFVEPVSSLLNNYEAIPWPHYQRASAYEINDSVTTVYRNLYENPTEKEKWLKVTDLLGPTGVYDGKIGAVDPISYMQVDTLATNIDYNFPISLDEDSALFEVQSYFKNSSESDLRYQWNDTTTRYQKFFNYYAYDDGTSESGYGIIGEGTENAMVAMRFRTYEEDTLRGVQFYFNQVLNNANQYSFKFHVWKESEGIPGNIVYTQEGLKPENADELNTFITYKLDSAIVLNGNFFMGWQKIGTTEMLNVGFDVNKVNNDKLYYNFAGNWIKSQLEGTVMIRPVFGKDINISTNTEQPDPFDQTEYTIYPNPAQDILHINLKDHSTNQYRVTIFDIYGKTYLDRSLDESYIDLSTFNNGVYLIRVTDNQRVSATKKFIIVR